MQYHHFTHPKDAMALKVKPLIPYIPYEQTLSNHFPLSFITIYMRENTLPQQSAVSMLLSMQECTTGEIRSYYSKIQISIIYPGGDIRNRGVHYILHLYHLTNKEIELSVSPIPPLYPTCNEFNQMKIYMYATSELYGRTTFLAPVF